MRLGSDLATLDLFISMKAVRKLRLA